MSITLKPYCKKIKTKKDGTAPIYIVVRIDRKETLISTGKYINPEFFDNDKGVVKKGDNNSMSLNTFLASEKGKLEKKILELQNQGEELTLERFVKDLETAKNKESLNFIDFCYKEIMEMKGILAKDTLESATCHINKLKAYKSEIKFSDINYDFLCKYQYHLVNKVGNGKNTVAGSFRVIRRFFNIANKKGITKNYPFKDFKFSGEDVEKNYLTLEEVDALHDLFDSGQLSKRLQNTLNYFLVSCYTGLRSADVKKLTQKNILGNDLSVKMNKTKKPILIPLSYRAAKLLDINSETELLFPKQLKQSRSRVNTDIIDIMDLVGVKKHITFHCSRHSFAINSLVLGIDITVISNILGHTTLKTTQIYAKIVDGYKKREMNKWNNNLSSYFLTKKSLSEHFRFLLPIIESDNELNDIYINQFSQGSMDEVNLIRKIIENLAESKKKVSEYFIKETA